MRKFPFATLHFLVVIILDHTYCIIQNFSVFLVIFTQKLSPLFCEVYDVILTKYVVLFKLLTFKVHTKQQLSYGRPIISKILWTIWNLICLQRSHFCHKSDYHKSLLFVMEFISCWLLCPINHLVFHLELETKFSNYVPNWEDFLFLYGFRLISWYSWL